MANKFQQSDPVAALLRSAGPREHAPSDRARRVESAVRAEWQTLVRQRHRRKRLRWIAAGTLAAAAAVTLFLQTQPRPSDERLSVPVATVDVPAEDVVPGFSLARMTSSSRHGASRPGMADDDRVPVGGLPRRILVNYSRETR